MEQVLQILKDEFKLAMMLSGRIVHIAVMCFAFKTSSFSLHECLQVVQMFRTLRQSWWCTSLTTPSQNQDYKPHILPRVQSISE